MLLFELSSDSGNLSLAPSYILLSDRHFGAQELEVYCFDWEKKEKGKYLIAKCFNSIIIRLYSAELHLY